MMSAASTDSAHGLMTDIRKVDSVVSTARRLLSEGKVVDLSALEGKIQDICRTIAERRERADGPTRAQLSALLEDLLGGLDALSLDLETQKGVFDDLVSQRSETAAKAYSSSKKKDKT